jgi:hypothetical protein
MSDEPSNAQIALLCEIEGRICPGWSATGSATSNS